MKVKLLMGVLVSMLVVLSLLAACAKASPSTSIQPPATSAASAAAPASPAAAASSASTSATANTLKIGYLGFLGYWVGVDLLHGIQVSIDMINQQGGLTIGAEKYKIELVSYDTNDDQVTAMAAVNKLIFQDKVKFIVSDATYIDAMIPITEANKVIICSADMTPVILSPQYHYCFSASSLNTGTDVAIGWLAKNYPDLKTIVIALPDSQVGHMIEKIFTPAFVAFGMTASAEYYPATATDLSSLGTKIPLLNPDLFTTVGGTFQPFAAAWQAGYRGQFFNPSPATTANYLAQLTADEVEGLIGGSSPTEFDPGLDQVAQDFKTAWIAKYGKWEGPEISNLSNFNCLVTALQKAGSLDPDAVADVISNGLKFETPNGSAMMISRPDLGNNRTVDCVIATYMKKIVGGKSELIATIPVEEGLGYFHQANPTTASKP